MTSTNDLCTGYLDRKSGSVQHDNNESCPIHEPDPKVVARFVPQQWVGEWATDIEGAEPIEWDATEAFAALPAPYRKGLAYEMDGLGESLDIDDLLRTDMNAPEQVRTHDGPFQIWVRFGRVQNNYRVTFMIPTFVTYTVEADTPEAAETRAWELHDGEESQLATAEMDFEGTAVHSVTRH